MKDRDTKGKFTSGNSAKKSQKNKIISAQAISNAPPQIPTERSELDITFDDFREFGKDNLFPQALAVLYRRGVAHRAIQFYKRIMTVGEGFVADENNRFLQDLIKSVNLTESFANMYSRLVTDHNGWGNSYMEIKTDRSGSFVAFFHHDTTTARLARHTPAVIIHPDWRRYRDSKQLSDTIPLYPVFQPDPGGGGILRSMCHFKEYEPEFKHYGIPNWIAAMDSVAIGYKTNKWNVSRLDNSFQVSGLLEVFADPGDKQLSKLDDFLRDLHKGEGNNSKLFKLVKQRGGDPTKFTAFTQDSEGEFLDLHKLSDDDLIMAHNWFRSLAGITDNTGFDTQRIRNEYAIASRTIIPETNNFFLDKFKKIIEEVTNNDASSLDVRPQSPISILDLLTADKFVKKGEARGILDLPVDDTDKRNDEFIDDGKSANVNING